MERRFFQALRIARGMLKAREVLEHDWRAGCPPMLHPDDLMFMLERNMTPLDVLVLLHKHKRVHEWESLRQYAERFVDVYTHRKMDVALRVLRRIIGTRLVRWHDYASLHDRLMLRYGSNKTCEQPSTPDRNGRCRPPPEDYGPLVDAEGNDHCGGEHTLPHPVIWLADATRWTPCALYRHFDKAGRLLYVGISLSPLARLSEHKRSSHWAQSIATVTVDWHACRRWAERAEVQAIQRERPLHNVMHNNNSEIEA